MLDSRTNQKKPKQSNLLYLNQQNIEISSGVFGHNFLSFIDKLEYKVNEQITGPSFRNCADI